MNVQVLVSTMNCKNGEKLAKEMKLSENYVIINQITKSDVKPADFATKASKFISFHEKGLSKSRNRAIDNASSDICVIADDDMYYEPTYESTISNAYERYPDADIIAFQVANEDPNARSKEVPAGKVGLIASMKLSSVRLTFKKGSLVKNDIRFNEDFGAGAKFYAGEENIFLAECLKKGLKIYYVPEKIATLRINENSSWFRGYDENYFNVKGLTYYFISKRFALLLILQFALRKRALYSKDVSVINAIKFMWQGIKKNKPKKRVYFAGDIVSNTGPANVNKKYAAILNDRMYFCDSNNKILRIIHFLLRVAFVDKVIVSGMSSFHLDVLRVSKLLKKETFYLMHGYNAVEYKLNGIEDGDDRIQLEQHILEECDIILCVSENFSKYLGQKNPQLGKKITFVNNGVDISSRSVRRNHNKIYTIVTVGGGMPRKNVLGICKAVDRLSDEDIRVVVIGSRHTNGNEIARYPFVEYYDSLSHKEVTEKMKEADLYIQNSLFETFGLAVCEALNEGCDLLIAKDVGARSVIQNLTSANIIESPSDSDEIAHKIRRLKNTNTVNLRFKEDTSWRSSSNVLMERLGIL